MLLVTMNMWRCVCQQQLKARLNPLQILFSANMQGFCLWAFNSRCRLIQHRSFLGNTTFFKINFSRLRFFRLCNWHSNRKSVTLWEVYVHIFCVKGGGTMCDAWQTSDRVLSNVQSLNFRPLLSQRLYYVCMDLGPSILNKGTFKWSNLLLARLQTEQTLTTSHIPALPKCFEIKTM